MYALRIAQRQADGNGSIENKLPRVHDATEIPLVS